MPESKDLESLLLRLEDLRDQAALKESLAAKELEAKQKERARLEAALLALNGEAPPPRAAAGKSDGTPPPRSPRLPASEQLNLLAQILSEEVGERNPSGLTDRQLRKAFNTRTGKTVRPDIAEKAAADPRFTRDAESGRWRLARAMKEVSA